MNIPDNFVQSINYENVDEMQEVDIKYQKLLEFVKQLSSECVYERYENLNEANWAAHDLLHEIGEL